MIASVKFCCPKNDFSAPLEQFKASRISNDGPLSLQQAICSEVTAGVLQACSSIFFLFNEIFSIKGRIYQPFSIYGSPPTWK